MNKNKEKTVRQVAYPQFPYIFVTQTLNFMKRKPKWQKAAFCLFSLFHKSTVFVCKKIKIIKIDPLQFQVICDHR